MNEEIENILTNKKNKTDSSTNFGSERIIISIKSHQFVRIRKEI